MNIYDFSFKTSGGTEVSLSDYKNKVILIVNTATRCGLAPQLVELEALHAKYQEMGLVVIGFPCDQFMGQEPETNETVAHVCKINFGVTFTLSQKIEVNGKNSHPIFAFLKRELPAGIFMKSIKWNFTKFLIDKNGIPFKRYAPTVSPLEMERDIQNLLK